MPQTFENPLGTDGFEFVEFTGPDPKALETLFRQLGFACVAKHRTKDILRFKQGDINLLLNREKGGQAEEFGKLPGVSERELYEYDDDDNSKVLKEWDPGKT